MGVFVMCMYVGFPFLKYIYQGVCRYIAKTPNPVVITHKQIILVVNQRNLTMVFG